MTKRLTILGGGESGVGSAILGKKKGYEVFVSDKGAIKPKFKQELIQNNIQFEEQKHSEERILASDIVVKSPGIPDHAPLVQALLNDDTPVISEIEFAGKYFTGKTICITGSNGKTTTTTLLYDLLCRSGLKVGVGGNIGASFARQIAEYTFDWFVLELSSFQLDGMFDFHANIAILLNITPDHLDRYDYKMEKYVDSKFRIIQNQTAEDCFIYFADDELVAKEVEKRHIFAQKYPFSVSGNPMAVASIIEDRLELKLKDEEFALSLDDLALEGKHNACNSMAAGISGMVLNIRKDDIRGSLIDFKGVEHRLESFMEVNNIEFINDSKATNINSTWYALESMTKPTVWILGGVDKGNDYTELFSLVRSKVKAIVCMGVDNKKIVDAFSMFNIPLKECASIEDAVRISSDFAEHGDAVLLSPSCASFDLFANYEERGNLFKKTVIKLSQNK